MFKNHKWLTILLSGKSLTIYPPESEPPTILPIPETLVANLELKNRDGIELMVSDWCKMRTYANTSVIWLLADDLVFEATLPLSDKDFWDQKSQAFLDTVPFEHTLSRKYVTEKGDLKLVATNHELIMAFVQSFAKHGYAPAVLVPLSLVPNANSLTEDTKTQVVNMVGELTNSSLLTLTATPTSSSDTSPVPPKAKSQLVPLLIIFGVLLVILVIVILLNY